MTDHDALLAAIIADPKEDTPRLVYADWLEENDQPERAEFIRVQVELASAGDNADPKCGRDFRKHYVAHGMRRVVCVDCYAALHRRERELLEVLGHGLLGLEWGAVVNHSPTIVVPEGWENIGHTFQRGFLAEVECPWQWWLTHAAAILKQQPIERVRLTTYPEYQHEGEMVALAGEDFWVNQVSRDGQIPVMKLFAAIWPRIEFELPAAGEITFRGHSLVTDVTIG